MFVVGQVLFIVINTGKPRLTPVQVVEQITKKTMKGEKISYIVSIGEEQKPLDLDSIPGEIFKSAQEAQDVLSKRAVDGVIKHVNAAVLLAKQRYSEQYDKSTAVASATKAICQRCGDTGKVIDEPDEVCTETVNCMKLAGVIAPQKQSSVSKNEEVEIVLENGQTARVKLPDTFAS
jgi:hypothetical protein